MSGSIRHVSGIKSIFSIKLYSLEKMICSSEMAMCSQVHTDFKIYARALSCQGMSAGAITAVLQFLFSSQGGLSWVTTPW